jgi:hypothetical protein
LKQEIKLTFEEKAAVFYAIALLAGIGFVVVYRLWGVL